METTTTQIARRPERDLQQRRYCDQSYHGTGTDAEADRWCYDHHQVRMPATPVRPSCCALHSSRPWDSGPCET